MVFPSLFIPVWSVLALFEYCALSLKHTTTPAICAQWLVPILTVYDQSLLRSFLAKSFYYSIPVRRLRSMADGGCNNSEENGVVELEVMRKDSFSWHPCQVSLGSKGLGLIVQYGDNYLEEMIEDTQEVLARIRVRSTPLQNDDCSSLQQGDHVLATRNSHVKGVFYDARVEEAIRVRHSKRSRCRCSFTIKWLHQALEEEVLTIPANGIMKLATKSINLHPTISSFFSILDSSNGLDTLPCSTIVDSINWEMDINMLLEKQIEEIVDLKTPCSGRAFDASLKGPRVAVPLLDNLKDFTGNNNQPMETIIETPPASIPSIQEEITGSRPPLNPLAALAALASLRSKFPRNAELSAQSNVEKGDITSEQGASKLPCRRKCCSFSAVDHSSHKDDFSLKVSATLGGGGPNFESTVKTLFPTSSAPQIVGFSNVSSRAQENGMEKRNNISEKKITQSSEARFTRAQVQRNNRMHESTQMTNSKETELRSAKTRRFTRSTINRAEKIDVQEHNAAVVENMQTEFVKLETFAQSTMAPQNHLSGNEKPIASPVDGETSICSAENDKSLLEKDGSIIKVDSQQGTFAEDAEKHNYPRRLTRSAAREETEKNVHPKLKSRKINFSESEVDLFKGKVSSESNRLKLEKSLTSPIATKVSKQFTEEREKNREVSPHVKTTPNDAESVIGGIQGMRRKSACPKKQERLFSHQLSFRPRTRSQTKLNLEI